MENTFARVRKGVMERPLSVGKEAGKMFSSQKESRECHDGVCHVSKCLNGQCE